MSFINTIREDIKTVQAQDPAAQSALVIFLSYPGLHAKWNHVPEHWLWEHGHRSLARVLSQITRHITGVEIHPAAQIGKHFFIDHAMGVVIGETTVVGDNCVLYQGVTLGGTGNETGKRHPTLGDKIHETHEVKPLSCGRGYVQVDQYTVAASPRAQPHKSMTPLPASLHN